MNPLPPWHHGFFKSPIAFRQRRRQGNHVLHVHALSGKQHDFMAQACDFEAVVRYQHTRHALPLDFFHQHGDQNIAQIAVQTDERLVQQGKVAAAQQQAQKCYPFRHATGQFGRIFVQIARSQPDFRRQRDDFAFIGFVHKDSDILHRGQVFRQAVFLKQKTRFAESIAYRARFRRFQARNQTQNRRLATAARPEQSFHFAMLQVQTEIVHDGVTENFKTHVFKTEHHLLHGINKISKGLVIRYSNSDTNTITNTT